MIFLPFLLSSGVLNAKRALHPFPAIGGGSRKEEGEK